MAGMGGGIPCLVLDIENEKPSFECGMLWGLTGHPLLWQGGWVCGMGYPSRDVSTAWGMSVMGVGGRDLCFCFESATMVLGDHDTGGLL